MDFVGVRFSKRATDLSFDLRSTLDSVMARIRGSRKKASSGVRVTGTFVNNI